MRACRYLVLLPIVIFTHFCLAQGNLQIEIDAFKEAIDENIMECVRDFVAAYEELPALEDTRVENRHQIVDNYYSDYVELFQEGSSQTLKHSEKTYYLQYYYLVNNPKGLRNKELLNDAGDGSKWSEVHARCHPDIARKLRELNHDNLIFDIFILNHDGEVVYTFYKENDLGVNFSTGLFEILEETEEGIETPVIAEDVTEDVAEDVAEDVTEVDEDAEEVIVASTRSLSSSLFSSISSALISLDNQPIDATVTTQPAVVGSSEVTTSSALENISQYMASMENYWSFFNSKACFMSIDLPESNGIITLLINPNSTVKLEGCNNEDN